MKKSHLARLLAFATIVLTTALPRTQAQSARQVAFRTLCLKYVDNLNSAYATSGKDGNVAVKLFTGNFSPVYKGGFTSDTAILYVDDAAAPNGKKIIAEGKLAKGDRQLFLVLPDPEKKLPYRIHCMADDTNAFPMGTVRFLNLTAYNSRLELAGAKLPPVKPGGIETYPPVTKADEWNMYQARIELQRPDGKWATVSSPSWKASKRKRDLVIATLDPQSRQPRMFTYKDIPEWLEQSGSN